MEIRTSIILSVCGDLATDVSPLAIVKAMGGLYDEAHEEGKSAGLVETVEFIEHFAKEYDDQEAAVLYRLIRALRME